MQITMLNGLGCASCGGGCSTSLGAVTKAEAEKFFIGDKKYVKNTKETPVYKAAGQAPYKTVPPNDTIGRIIRLNDKANWGILENGDWVLLADTMYTVILTTPPPTSITDAVTREIEKIPFLPSKTTLYLILGTVALVGTAVIVSRFKPPAAQKVVLATK